MRFVKRGSCTDCNRDEPHALRFPDVVVAPRLLPGKHDAMRNCGSRPAVRPLAIIEAESGLAVCVVKRRVHGYDPGSLVELDHEQTMNIATGYD